MVAALLYSFHREDVLRLASLAASRLSLQTLSDRFGTMKSPTRWTATGRVESAATTGTGRSRCETATWQHRWQLSHSSLTFMAAPAGWAEGRLDGGQRDFVPPERPAATAAKLPVAEPLAASTDVGHSPSNPATRPDRSGPGAPGGMPGHPGTHCRGRPACGRCLRERQGRAGRGAPLVLGRLHIAPLWPATSSSIRRSTCG